MAIHSISTPSPHGPGARHETRPDPETIRSASGEPVSLLVAPPPGSFPLAASCASCGDPITLASRSLLADWSHVPGPRRPA